MLNIVRRKNTYLHTFINTLFNIDGIEHVCHDLGRICSFCSCYLVCISEAVDAVSEVDDEVVDEAISGVDFVFSSDISS